MHTNCISFLSLLFPPPCGDLWYCSLSVGLPWNCLAFALGEFRCIAPHIRFDSLTGCVAIDGGMGTCSDSPSLRPCCLRIGRTSSLRALVRCMRGVIPAALASICVGVMLPGTCAAARNGAGRCRAVQGRLLPVRAAYIWGYFVVCFRSMDKALA